MRTLALLALALVAQTSPQASPQSARQAAPQGEPAQKIDSLVPVRPGPTAKRTSAQSPSGQTQPAQMAAPAGAANGAQGDTTEVTAAPEPIVAAYAGSFEQGFAEIRTHAEKGEFDPAIGTADALLAPNAFLRWRDARRARGGWRAWVCDKFDPLLDTAGWNGLPPEARAELWYAKGVVSELAQKPAGADTAQLRAAAEESYSRALGLAGSLDVGLDALYDLGTLALRTGEEERAKLPEISGQPAQVAPPAASAPPAGDEKAPDPLELARAAYMKARAHYVDRLKTGARDPDTQANTELVMKRLRELDEIQKKREEQKKQDKDKDKKDQDKKDKQKQDEKDKQDKDKQDKSDKQDPKDKSDKQEPPKDPQADENEKKDEKKPEDAKPDDKKPDDKDKPKPQPQPDPNDPKQQQMSKEQMTQILDRLQQLEDQSKRIQEQLRAARRAKVKKDW